MADRSMIAIPEHIDTMIKEIQDKTFELNGVNETKGQIVSRAIVSMHRELTRNDVAKSN